MIFDGEYVKCEANSNEFLVLSCNQNDDYGIKLLLCGTLLFLIFVCARALVFFLDSFESVAAVEFTIVYGAKILLQ